MSSIEKVVKQLKRSPAKPTDVLDRRDDVNLHKNKNYSEQNKTPLHIDLEKLQQMGFVTTIGTDSKKLEEFRILKRPIIDNAFGKLAAIEPNSNMIMITSSVAGEGKTFTALSLAMSIAMERDTTVLLVDCDVINPSLSNILELHEHQGLIDVLLESDVTLGDVIIKTNIPQLKLIPSGLPQPQSTELLASDKMALLVDELSQRYSDRIVIFDSPPLLLTSQAPVLSQLMGQIVVVVEADKTPQQLVKDAIDLLDTDKTIGLVLNKMRKTGSGGYYGGYYASRSVEK